MSNCPHKDYGMCNLCTYAEENPVTEHDPVNHPTHYMSDATCDNCGESIECIQVVRHHQFARGNAIKYLWRAGAKGDLVEDLKKAIWYIEEEIAQAEGRPNPNVHRLGKGGSNFRAADKELIDESNMAYREWELNPVAHLNLNDPRHEMPIGRVTETNITDAGLEIKADLRKCDYIFEQGAYLCGVHGMKESKHHPRKGADRPCLAIDPE